MNIYQSLAAVQADVDFIGKDKETKTGNTYRYRGVDQVLNTLHPLFAKHKVIAVPEVLEVLSRETRETKNGAAMLYQVLKVRYVFYAEDGTSVSAIVVGEAMDSGDKVSNKCMSVAYKYACFQILSIPTEETTQDPDDENEALKPHTTPQNSAETGKKKPSVGKRATPPITEKELKNYGVQDIRGTILWIEGRAKKSLEELDEDEKEAARGILKRKQEEKEAENIPAPWDENYND